MSRARPTDAKVEPLPREVAERRRDPDAGHVRVAVESQPDLRAGPRDQAPVPEAADPRHARASLEGASEQRDDRVEEAQLDRTARSGPAFPGAAAAFRARRSTGRHRRRRVAGRRAAPGCHGSSASTTAARACRRRSAGSRRRRSRRGRCRARNARRSGSPRYSRAEAWRDEALSFSIGVRRSTAPPRIEGRDVRQRTRSGAANERSARGPRGAEPQRVARTRERAVERCERRLGDRRRLGEDELPPVAERERRIPRQRAVLAGRGR